MLNEYYANILKQISEEIKNNGHGPEKVKRTTVAHMYKPVSILNSTSKKAIPERNLAAIIKKLHKEHYAVDLWDIVETSYSDGTSKRERENAVRCYIYGELVTKEDVAKMNCEWEREMLETRINFGQFLGLIKTRINTYEPIDKDKPYTPVILTKDNKLYRIECNNGTLAAKEIDSV